MWTSLTAVGGAAGGEAGGEGPCARAKHAAALHGGHVYVLGGRGGGGALPLRDFWRYSLEEARWERVVAAGAGGGSAAPPALQEHSLVAHGQCLYVFGGEAGAGAEVPLWIYDTQTQLWRKPTTLAGAAGRRGARGQPPPGPRPRRGHSAHALHDCLLIYGGYMDLKGTTDELWAFHYESETWRQVRAARAGPARHRHAAALLGARLLVHGGRCDLRACADLWLYDTLSRSWSALRPRGPAPPARCGHAGLRAGAHFYIFGGEVNGQPCDELWRFHFATETWERLHAGPGWPAARVDCAALLLGTPGAAPAPPPPAPAPAAAQAAAGLLRGLSRLSALHLRRGGGRARGAYSALARDSTESLPRVELSKSRSAHTLELRPTTGGGGGGGSPRAGDEAERRGELAREPVSVPDFGDALLAARATVPALSPRGTKLVFLDSEEEEEQLRRPGARGAGQSISVRFDTEQTSEYESEPRLALGFCNPHYLCGEQLTPDSGIELQELRPRAAPPAPPAAPAPVARLLLLVVGGREPARPALQQRALPLWLYRLL